MQQDFCCVGPRDAVRGKTVGYKGISRRKDFLRVPAEGGPPCNPPSLLSSSWLARCSALWGGAFAVGLPEGWASADVGAPSQAGGAAYDAETKVWTVQGGGADVWDQSDHCHFAYLTRGDHFDAHRAIGT
jgi:hypothetical protein